MNALEYAEMRAGEPVSNRELFEILGRYTAEQDVENSKTISGVEPDDVKTTSVRISEKKLIILDAIASKFGVTRTDAFSFAVSQFIVDAVIGYAGGYAGYLDDSEQNIGNNRDIFINSLQLDDDMKDYVRKMTENEFLYYLGVK